MQHKARAGRGRGLLARLLLFAVLALLLRLAYVAFSRGAFSFAGPTPRDRAVAFYSAAFRDMLSEGFLSPASKSLSLSSHSGLEAAALKKLGVRDATAFDKKRVRQVFDNDTFDFVFAGGGLIERSQPPLGLASEIARVIKPEGFLAIHTTSAGDPYSLHSLLDLFPCCRMVRSRELDDPDSSAKIREVVLQKEEGSQILRPGRMEEKKSINNCSFLEHKHQLVELAEPLIEEEPSKPWVTLKRNLMNIKYLPMMADISFKNRYVFVDVGARNYGSSIGSWFKKQYPKQNHVFEIYAIEADSVFHAEYGTKRGINLLPYAAWVRNETLAFEVNHDSDQKDMETGRGMGWIKPTGAASKDLSSENVQMIDGFDFAEWLKNTMSARDFVVMKMDVEGTEFDLVPRLFETGAICLINELFLECHYNRWQRCCPGERTPKYHRTYEQCLELFIPSGRVGSLSISGGDS